MVQVGAMQLSQFNNIMRFLALRPVQIKVRRQTYPRYWKSNQRMIEQPKSIGEQIRKHRLELHLIQADVAQKLGATAKLNAEDIDWNNRGISYARAKTGQPARVRFDEGVEKIFRSLPQTGPLFPYLRSVRAGDRATEFKQRCKGLGIEGVTLHSYRYSWAERAWECGYFERLAQEALGHGSKAVHRAYARGVNPEHLTIGEWKKRQSQANVVSVEFKEAARTAFATAMK
jgi:integrase